MLDATQMLFAISVFSPASVFRLPTLLRRLGKLQLLVVMAALDKNCRTVAFNAKETALSNVWASNAHHYRLRFISCEFSLKAQD